MRHGNLAISRDSGTMGREPDILRAAMIGDIQEGMAAIRENPDCIYKREPTTGMIALQVALCNWQNDFVKFLLNTTEVSAHAADARKRDSLDVALEFLCDDEIVELVKERWFEHLYLDMPERPAEIIELLPRQPKPK